MFDVAIIGCGIIGAAVAYELSKYTLDVVILEKENDVANGTTKANSAIIHAGYDPEPGTSMATLNVQGNRMAKELFIQLDIPFKACGSLVLAFSSEEVPTLERLLNNGKANGVLGLQIISGDDARKREPSVSESVVAALYAPSAMIVSPWEYALALAEVAVKNGAALKLECEVKAIEKADDCYNISTSDGVVKSRYIINAAGIHADEIHDMVAAHTFKISADRGEYYLLDKSEGGRVSKVIFQCPSKDGKGVLVAPTVHGNLIVGPSNGAVESKNDVSTTEKALKYVMTTAKKSVADINFRASIRNFSGNRANPDCGDFVISEAEDAKGFIDVAGIKSPGLSAAPAIAVLAAELLQKSGLELIEKPDFVSARKRVRFSELSHTQRAAIVSENPAYGRVICRCETVTEGEILDALSSPIPPRSVDAVKRRCGAGMGRCQGGFCGARILEILANQLNIDPTQVLQDSVGTYILTSQTKKAGENNADTI